MNLDPIERARRYLGHIPSAVQGSGGDAATYKAAVILVKGFALTPEQAFPLLWEWNAACSPPWSERALRSKLASATRSSGPVGYLLEKDSRRSPSGVQRPRRSGPGGQNGGNARATAPASPVPVGNCTEEERAEKKAKRRRWPAFLQPNNNDQAAIAALRYVSHDVTCLMAALRYLWRCRWREAECLAVRCGTCAQVRRMDGQPFTCQDGTPKKALSLPGSEGAFFNPGGMGAPGVPVILTEGAISILEAAEAIQRADGLTHPLHSVAVLAAVSAGSRFTAAHLEKLAGRRVRIIPDADPAGQDAAAIWAVQLRASSCTVDCVKLPGGCKDLGDALRHISAGDPFWGQLLTL